MVKGLDVFNNYFHNFEKYYTIIGGTACDCWISKEGLTPRATNDIDLLIVLEEYNAEFNNKLWSFISDADYKSMQREMKDQQFYRFEKPENKIFPVKLELMCRDPKIIQVPEGGNITAIDPKEDFSHLSVMVINDEYYQFTLKHSYVLDGLHIARVEALICLKTQAYLNLSQASINGAKINSDDLNKHWRDVFRLTILLKPGDIFEVPRLINNNLREFVNQMETKNPDVKDFLKKMGIANVSMADLIAQLRNSFSLLQE